MNVSTPGIRVKNAGIVLLNSYIKILFERVGLTHNDSFVNDSSQTNAVHYLQYVITGLDTTEDNVLPLNKVLCGLPLNHPAQDRVIISEEHKKLMESLISGVIGYWPVIGNSSIAGFRGNWLVRDGVLVEHDDRWELTVEKRSYDILISQSPFSFSVVKYNWMEKPLYVIWPY